MTSPNGSAIRSPLEAMTGHGPGGHLVMAAERILCDHPGLDRLWLALVTEGRD